MTNKQKRGPRLYQVSPVPLKRIKSAADLKYTWDGLGIYDEEDLNEVRHVHVLHNLCGCVELLFVMCEAHYT